MNSDPYESVLHVGWMEDSTRKTGSSSRVSMHKWIAEGGNAYVRDIDGNDFQVVHMISGSGMKCLRTIGKKAENDPLFRLIDCR